MHSQRALELYDELGRLGPQATIYNNLGTFAYYEARWDDAVQLFDKARQLRLRLGDEVDAALGTFNTAEVRSDQGRLDEARSRFEEAGRVWRAADYSSGVGHVTVASAHSPAARRVRARPRAVRRCRTRFEALAEHDLIDTDARIAESLVLQERPRDALEMATALLERSETRGGAVQDPMLYRVRGYALAQRGQWQEASLDLERSVTAARERSARYELAVTLDAIAKLAELRDGSPNRSARDEADALLRSLDVISVPAVQLKPSAVGVA